MFNDLLMRVRLLDLLRAKTPTERLGTGESAVLYNAIVNSIVCTVGGNCCPVLDCVQARDESLEMEDPQESRPDPKSCLAVVILRVEFLFYFASTDRYFE